MPKVGVATQKNWSGNCRSCRTQRYAFEDRTETQTEVQAGLIVMDPPTHAMIQEIIIITIAHDTSYYHARHNANKLNTNI